MHELFDIIHTVFKNERMASVWRTYGRPTLAVRSHYYISEFASYINNNT